MPTHDFIDIGDVLSVDILRGTIKAIDSTTDTCTVDIGGAIFDALLFYHCNPDSVLRSNGAIMGAAKGFKAGNEVIVLKKSDNSVVKVIGHVYGIRPCAEEEPGKYYIFYRDGGTTKIALCSYASGVITKIDTKTAANVGMAPTTTPVTFHLKKFRHNVAGKVRDLYFVATTLYINPAPYTGWTNFKAANPAFPLVTNNANTQITMMPQVMVDMNTINALVNTLFIYIPDPVGNDNWGFLSGGTGGDCEDFALEKAKRLLAMGYPASAIHIEVTKIDGSVPGHAWCVVQTTEGDYALDTSSNTPMLNSALRPTPTTKYTGRRRQIGSNWAFISPYGWMGASSNITAPWTAWYILDPLLNIFYIINTSPWAYPFAQVVGSANPDALSTPSINFSTDKIYVAENGTIKAYKLNENSLDVVASTTYTARGFVGRDGNIVEPDGTFGRQDPYHFGGHYDNTRVNIFNGVNFLSGIKPDRIGTFKSFYGCEVISEDGYYDYRYRYLTGEFSGEGFWDWPGGDGSVIQY